MNRRKFLLNSGLVGLGSMLLNPFETIANSKKEIAIGNKSAKNIIFLVSDGMSLGTLNMTDLLMQRKLGRDSKWISLIKNNEVSRAMMDTASADSLITDSAAAGSSWGGGVRVNNGSINVGPNGEEYTPILQKFKTAGKAVGCVTTVPITHATPASFCVNMPSRKKQEEIAEKYLDLEFDVMMGGGLEYFDAKLRSDKKDLFADFNAKGFKVAKSKNDLLQSDKPVIGVFNESGLPYSLDVNSDNNNSIPSLSEMTSFSIEKMKNNPNGFVLQVEGGKVDWAAHANDTPALLYDQMEFDKAVDVAIDFAEKDKNTLVIITTDHGNSNPGLFYGKNANTNFEKFYDCKHTNEWVLKGIDKNTSANTLIERVELASGCVITNEESLKLLSYYEKLDSDGIYNPYKLPFKELANIQSQYNSVGWAGIHHSADYVELAMFGPGKELLNPFIKNTELHNLMLKATGVYKE